MTERRDEQGRGEECEGQERRQGRVEQTRRRSREEGLARAEYASTEGDQTRSRELVRGSPLDEAGEIPSADGDVEEGISRRAERYED